MENIYKAPNSELAVDDKIGGEYAGFWIRLVAWIADLIWLVILDISIGWLMFGDLYFETDYLYINYKHFIVSEGTPFIITLLFWTYLAATPGKMLLGLKIVDARTYERVPVGRLALRYIGYIFSTLILGLGFLCIAWDERKQGLHDKLAKTLVIKMR